MRKFDDYLNKNSITHKITLFYLSEQNVKAKKVKRTTIRLVRTILTKQTIPMSL